MRLSRDSWDGARVSIYLTAGAFLLAAGFSVAILPALPFAFVAIALAAVGFWHPKSAILIGVTLTLFGVTVEQLLPNARLGLFDEVFILYAALLALVSAAVARRPLRGLPGSPLLLLFISCGVTSSLLQGTPPLLSAQDAFLLTKGFIFAFAVLQLDWSEKDLHAIARLGGWILGFILGCTAVNAFMPATWNSIITPRSDVSIRGGIVVLVGPFTHPGVLGQVMALGAIGLIAYRQQVRRTNTTLILLVGCVLSVAVTVRRKAIAGLIATALWLSWQRSRSGFLLFGILIFPLAGLLTYDLLVTIFNNVYYEYFENPTAAARTVLYTNAFDLANSQFPVGVGFSQYGTFVAGENYSPLYRALGFRDVWGLQPGGRFLTDTFWPAILAETGWVGTLGYIGALVALTSSSVRVCRSTAARHIRWFGIMATAWSIEYALESVAAPVYSSPPTNLLLFGSLGVAAALNASQSREDASIETAPSAQGAL